MSQLPVVLIVDDDDIVLSVVESMVQMLGFPVMTACDGIEAIAIFREHADDIGCVVLDIQMPRMNGIMTFQQLREIRENIQVIIASGYLGEANLDQLGPLQPAGYLQKPVFFQAFSELLKKCLQDVDLSDRE
jgi:CheY-like chemotaxis protein